tara:strand:+ start:169 stop:567 length:399 start_codon:yes stop_codon:yes gene_type:complete
LNILVWHQRNKGSLDSIKEKKVGLEAVQHDVLLRQYTYYVLTRSFIMSMYVVHVIIENKPNISDPEGDTILNDLVLKSKNPSIKKIRAGKILKFTVEASNKKKAEKTVENICQELRIFNPLVSKVVIEAKTN